VDKSAYTAAKHGIVGFTKVTALETAEEAITCNAICPGFVRTPLIEDQIRASAARNNVSFDEGVKFLLAAKQPSKTFATVDQVR
jgi:3-hydroxybutyrate dehydrogenase